MSPEDPVPGFGPQGLVMGRTCPRLQVLVGERRRLNGIAQRSVNLCWNGLHEAGERPVSGSS